MVLGGELQCKMLKLLIFLGHSFQFMDGRGKENSKVVLRERENLDA